MTAFMTLLWQLNWPVIIVFITTGFIASLLIFSFIQFRHRILSGFERALLHIEAVRMEDYNQFAKPEFEQGKSSEFHHELKALSEQLLAQKSRYDQHAFLVYQLIDQLDTPILVFNQKNKLSYANGAFSLLYEQQWQMYRQASPELLGLVKKNNSWQFKQSDKQANKQWQISQSEFIDAGEAHQLLVFTNIESALRSSQQKAWQQIIRVMGHEIRNSLTPVASIAESLAERSASERDQQALELISDRCTHLQDFLNRYSSLSQELNLNSQLLKTEKLVERLKGLFTQVELKLAINAEWILADASFLEQVLINLIKNSIEANAGIIELEISETKDKLNIIITDNGHGFANLDNSFVPLFTTKQDGQGIGLSFCRNIIEQHQGSIELENNLNQGITVTISLPIAQTTN